MRKGYGKYIVWSIPNVDENIDKIMSTVLGGG